MNIARTLTRLATTTLAAIGVAGAIAIAGAGTAAAAPPDCNYMGYQSAPDRLGIQWDGTEQQMANMINQYRGQHGLPALQMSGPLERPAMWASLDSARRGFSPSDHVDTRGMGIVERAQFCGDYTGPIAEINYWGEGGAGGNYFGSAEAALAWWKQDPPHNAILLSTDYTHIAVARAYMGVNAERQHWTIDFGTS